MNSIQFINKKKNISRIPLKISDDNPAHKVAFERCAFPSHPKDIKENSMDVDFSRLVLILFSFRGFCFKEMFLLNITFYNQKNTKTIMQASLDGKYILL